MDYYYYKFFSDIFPQSHIITDNLLKCKHACDTVMMFVPENYFNNRITMLVLLLEVCVYVYICG